jgi:hypothetical protein
VVGAVKGEKLQQCAFTILIGFILILDSGSTQFHKIDSVLMGWAEEVGFRVRERLKKQTQRTRTG